MSVLCAEQSVKNADKRYELEQYNVIYTLQGGHKVCHYAINRTTAKSKTCRRACQGPAPLPDFSLLPIFGTSKERRKSATCVYGRMFECPIAVPII